jgi:Flp pilus assembly pilin Flp
MLKFFGKHLWKKNRKGQGMTEYIIIVALIAVACIVIVSLFGQQIRSVFASLGIAISGSQETGQDTLHIKSFHEQLTADRDKQKGLDQYESQRLRSAGGAP